MSTNGTIALVSLGEVNGWVLDSIGDAAHAAFGKEIRIIGESPETRGFGGSRQTAASDVIKLLFPFRMSFGRVLGVTNVDLSYPGVNHVFGLADPESRVSVISLFRLCTRGAVPGKIAGRAVKTAVHEIGHTYGLGHCTDHRCVMFFSFNLADTDYKGREFCKKCREEIYSLINDQIQTEKEVAGL